MPGLLQTPPDRYGKSKYFMAAACEFFANIFFSFAGSLILSTALSRDPPDVVLAGWGNGMALALAIYGIANSSGGHITPSVTIATIITGHIPPLQGLLYMVAQLAGCCFGSLIVAGLVPDVYVGMGNSAAAYGCFEPHTPGVTNGQVFGFEIIISFILVYTAYAVAISEPGFGNIGPFVVGLSLSVDVWAAGVFSGSGVSPWRVFGPGIVFHCRWEYAWIYFLGDMAGGVVAGLVAIPLYGAHAVWVDKLFPWSHHHEHNEWESDGSMKGKVVQPPAMDPHPAYLETGKGMDSMDTGKGMGTGTMDSAHGTV